MSIGAFTDKPGLTPPSQAGPRGAQDREPADMPEEAAGGIPRPGGLYRPPPPPPPPPARRGGEPAAIPAPPGKLGRTAAVPGAAGPGRAGPGRAGPSVGGGARPLLPGKGGGRAACGVAEPAALAKMVRKLKYHEQKLLRRLELVSWEAAGGSLAEVKALRRYRLGRRQDYVQYKALARAVRALARRLRDLGPASAAFRARCAAALLEKLYGLGLVSCRRSLAACERLSAAAFCRRRLPCLLVKLRMAQNLRHAVAFVEQGHVRVGPEVVTDPALLVPRAVEDFVTWVDASRLRQKVLDYNQERDDFDLAA